mgnify:CR=1 FL=1
MRCGPLGRLGLVIAAFPRALPPHRRTLRAWYENIVHAIQYVLKSLPTEESSGSNIAAFATHRESSLWAGHRFRGVQTS